MTRSRRWLRLSIAAAALAAAGASPVPAAAQDYEEWRGKVAVETRLFPQTPLFPGQRRHDVSILAEPEYYAEWADRSNLTVVPFVRLDSSDRERTHGDVREFLYRRVGADWDLAAGVGRVFWGVTESRHLVDIVNQIDLIENIDGEDKLGQPMVNLTLLREWGTVDLFYLPYFRERTFPGRAGRLRPALVVDTDRARYESGLRRWYPDVVARYSNSVGKWDYGLYQFHGTSREPVLVPGLNPDGALVLFPEYDLINQTGLDLQYTTGAWLWKLEALYRHGQRNLFGERENFAAWVGGFEYTWFDLAGSNIDVGLLGEWLYDTRGRRANLGFANDIFVGSRVALNDLQDTQFLGGIVQNLESSARLLSLEASRRIGDSYRLTLELRAFLDIPANHIFAPVRRDDHLLIELGYFF